MRNKMFFSVIILAFFTLSMNAQDIKPAPEKKICNNGIGIGAGFTTGFGLSYKRSLPAKLAFQINLTPFKNNDNNKELYSVGFTIMETINESSWNNLYVYLANHYFYNRGVSFHIDPFYSYDSNKYEYDPITGNYVYKIKTKEKWNTGIGIGWEFNTQKKVVMNIMMGYAQYNHFEKLNFTGELALHYKF